jgi:hypothetical protein
MQSRKGQGVLNTASDRYKAEREEESKIIVHIGGI